MGPEFARFETATVRDVRVRAGDNRRTVTLQLKKMEDSVTVGRDGQTSGLDPRGNAFSTVLTREMILNRANDVGHPGVVTSPFYGQSTNVMSPRKLQGGLRFGF